MYLKKYISLAAALVASISVQMAPTPASAQEVFYDPECPIDPKVAPGACETVERYNEDELCRILRDDYLRRLIREEYRHEKCWQRTMDRIKAEGLHGPTMDRKLRSAEYMEYIVGTWEVSGVHDFDKAVVDPVVLETATTGIEQITIEGPDSIYLGQSEAKVKVSQENIKIHASYKRFGASAESYRRGRAFELRRLSRGGYPTLGKIRAIEVFACKSEDYDEQAERRGEYEGQSPNCITVHVSQTSKTKGLRETTLIYRRVE